VIVELPVSKWIQDPEGRDLAICRVDMENFSGIPNAVSFDSLLSEGMVSEFDVGPGDEVFMSGRFTGFTGKDASPICRFGHIVSKPMLVEVEHGKFEEDYLIEVHSFSGHSGSPVFVYKPGEDPYKPGEDPAVLCRQDRIFLLGIEVGTRWRRDPVYQKKLPPPPERDANRFIQSATNISYVVPAWRLRDLLESDADARQLFTEQRKRRQEESGFGIMTTDDTDVEYFWRYDWEEF
jgi:hypothetical protein